VQKLLRSDRRRQQNMLSRSGSEAPATPNVGASVPGDPTQLVNNRAPKISAERGTCCDPERDAPGEQQRRYTSGNVGGSRSGAYQLNQPVIERKPSNQRQYRGTDQREPGMLDRRISKVATRAAASAPTAFADNSPAPAAAIEVYPAQPNKPVSAARAMIVRSA
jgi:hypothetical protein